MTAALVIVGTFVAAPALAQAPARGNDRALTQRPEPDRSAPARRVTLEQLERMALEGNPTLAQAQARVRAARARLEQAGRYPNPTLGYSGDEISRGPIIRGGEHGFFVDQTIVLGGKLGKNRAVFEAAVAAAEAEAEAQRLRVLNAVRILHHEALAGARRVEVREKLVALAEEAVKTSYGLFNVGASDRPDLLEVENEFQRERLALGAARDEASRVGNEIAALVGALRLDSAEMSGDLDAPIPVLDRDATLKEILAGSPVLKAARAGGTEAQSAVARARSRRIPDLKLRAGIRYNRELLEPNLRPVGVEAFADVGVEIPLFDRNQGNIEAAVADAGLAEQEIRRTEMVIRARFGSLFESYRTAAARVDVYRKEIIPRAEQAHRLYLERFREMAAAYPQVLIARRSEFHANLDLISALESAWKAVVLLRGHLLSDGFGAPGPGPRPDSGEEERP